MSKPKVDLTAIANRLGRDYQQQIMSRDMHPKGSAEWHRFDQGRWAFREAALVVNRAAGYALDIYGEWLDEWTPDRTPDERTRLDEHNESVLRAAALGSSNEGNQS